MKTFGQRLRSGVRPAGQAGIPSGLPVGTIVQTGSSITPTFVAVVAGLTVAAGGLAYYLTRTDATPQG